MTGGSSVPGRVLLTILSTLLTAMLAACGPAGGEPTVAVEASAAADPVLDFPRSETTSGADGLTVVLPESLLFATGSADLGADARQVLADLAELIRRRAGSAVSVIGHTDGRGSPAHNLDLSHRRAEGVRQALVALGVAPALLTARGAGEQSPLRPETGPDGRPDLAAMAANRRVEVLVQHITPS